jgi:hypothetical protein
MPGNDSPAGREAAGRSRPASVAYAARRTARDEQGAETVASRGGKPSDTRLKVLDRILFEALDWKHEAVFTEPATASGYLDYLLTASGAAR